MLEGLPQQKDPSRVLSLPPPLGGHIGACVGWFVCCLFSFVCRNAEVTTGEQGYGYVNYICNVPTKLIRCV